MFGKNKKMQSNADVTDIGNGSSRMKAGSSSGQIQDFSGDVGRIGADKPLKEKKKNAGLASKGAKSKKALIQSISVPKTVQQSIPYRKVYTNGIIETEEGIFTKCYRLTVQILKQQHSRPRRICILHMEICLITFHRM